MSHDKKKNKESGENEPEILAASIKEIILTDNIEAATALTKLAPDSASMLVLLAGLAVKDNKGKIINFALNEIVSNDNKLAAIEFINKLLELSGSVNIAHIENAYTKFIALVTGMRPTNIVRLLENKDSSNSSGKVLRDWAKENGFISIEQLLQGTKNSNLIMLDKDAIKKEPASKNIKGLRFLDTHSRPQNKQAESDKQKEKNRQEEQEDGEDEDYIAKHNYGKGRGG